MKLIDIEEVEYSFEEGVLYKEGIFYAKVREIKSFDKICAGPVVQFILEGKPTKSFYVSKIMSEGLKS